MGIGAYRDYYWHRLLWLLLVEGLVVEDDQHVVAELLHQALCLIGHFKLVLLAAGHHHGQQYEQASGVGARPLHSCGSAVMINGSPCVEATRYYVQPTACQIIVQAFVVRLLRVALSQLELSCC